MFTGTCFTCGGVGHQSYQCPEKGKEKRIHLIQEENKEEEEVRKTGKVDLETGESLMIRRGKEWTPQVSIFRTNCLIQGEVYKLVIDSGTCSNLISWDVVNALKLPIQHHPKPYYATWVEDNQNFIVHHQAMITFSIGEYTDQVLCDVVNMNCAHVILGRTWQVSRKVTHDCYTNIYTLWNHGKRVELIPLP